MVAVGGTDIFGRHWAEDATIGSNYGEWLDITGPAGQQYTCDTTGFIVKMGRGTSFAAPRVAGIAALISNQTGLRGEALREVMFRSADGSDHLNEDLY